MKRTVAALLVLSGAGLFPPLFGLRIIPSAYAQSQSAESATKLVLKEGTEVKLTFAQSLSSKTATEGDHVDLLLAEDLKLGDVVIAKAGAKAVGHVTRVKKAGMMGKAGELNIGLDHLLVQDARVPLRGAKAKKGGVSGTAMAATMLLGVAGLMVRGNNVDVKEGAPLLAYVDQDFAVPGAAVPGAATSGVSANAPARPLSPGQSETPPAVSQLIIQSRPGGAQVYLDDALKGMTSEQEGRLRIDGLVPGSHRLRLSLPGYKEWSQQTVLSPGENLPVSVRLESSGPKPLQEAEVEEALKKGISKTRMKALVEQYGVDFELNDAIETRLRAAGADTEVLLAISKAHRR